MRKLDHDQERIKIAEVAAHLIAEHGAKNVTANLIATAMNATRGKVLHYFDSSQSVIDAAFDWANQRGVNKLKTLLSEPEQITLDVTILESLLPLDAEGDMEWKVRLACWEHSLESAGGLEYQQTVIRNRIEQIEPIITQLQQSGHIRNDFDSTVIAQQVYDLMVGAGCTLIYLPMEERRERAASVFQYFNLIMPPAQ